MSIQRVLDPRVLRASYQQQPTSSPTALTDFYFTNPVTVEAEEYQLVVNPYDAKPAPLNVIGGSARVVDLVGLSERKGVLIPSFNKQPLPDWLLRSLRDPENHEIDLKGRREVDRQQRHFVHRHRIQKELVLANIFSKGKLYVDSTGNIRAAAGADVIELVYDIPASRQNQLDGLWELSIANPACNVQKYFDAIDRQSEQDNHWGPTEVWCNSKMKDHLRALTDFREWAAASASDSETLLRGGFIPGLFGKNWHFYDGMYEDPVTHVKYPFIPDGQLVMTPPPNQGGWYEAAVGSNLVPTVLDIHATAGAALDSTEVVYGEYAYAIVTQDPWKLWHYMGDLYGINFNEPRAVWQPTVVYVSLP